MSESPRTTAVSGSSFSVNNILTQPASGDEAAAAAAADYKPKLEELQSAQQQLEHTTLTPLVPYRSNASYALPQAPPLAPTALPPPPAQPPPPQQSHSVTAYSQPSSMASMGAVNGSAYNYMTQLPHHAPAYPQYNSGADLSHFADPMRGAGSWGYPTGSSNYSSKFIHSFWTSASGSQ